MSQSVTSARQGPPVRSGVLATVLAMLLLLALVVAGLVAGGEAAALAQAGMESLPFAPLAVLAYLGVERRWARYATLLYLAGLVMVFAVLGLALGAVSLMEGSVAPGSLQLVHDGGPRLLVLSLGNCLAMGCGAICLARPVRRYLGRHLPLDPESFVHAVALSAVVSVTLLCLAPLAASGQPPLIAVESLLVSQGTSLSAMEDAAAVLRSTVYGLVWMVPVAFVCVGLGVRRGLRQAAARLGLVMPTWRQVAMGVGLAVALIAGVQVLSLVLDRVWLTMGWPRTGGEAFDEAFDSLLSAFMSPVGAIVLAVTAGLGEEVAVRGVLQPRLGIVLSSAFFASLHAFQYRWDGLIVVFALGIALGLIRQRSNTSVAAIAHGTYDLILMAMVLVGTSVAGQ